MPRPPPRRRPGCRSAVIEGGDEVGGLCILRGCMPSKSLLESAKRFDTLRRATEFGLRAENISARGEEIIARKKRLIKGFADYRRKQLETGAFDFIRGMAGFVDEHTLEIVSAQNERTQITGARISHRHGFGEAGDRHPGTCRNGISRQRRGARCDGDPGFGGRAGGRRGGDGIRPVLRGAGEGSHDCAAGRTGAQGDGCRCRGRAGHGI